jgi:uncharacterized membrane protein
MDFLFQVFLTLLVFTLVDLVWLVKVAPKLYRSQIGHLMADKVNYPGAILFYIIFIVGLVYFVIYPSESNVLQAWLNGSIFGLVTYATYDLTNLATLKAWPIKITIIDLAWGSFVTGITSLLVVLLLGFGG